MNKAQRDIRRKKRVLEHAARIGNVRKTCRYFGVARSHATDLLPFSVGFHQVQCGGPESLNLNPAGSSV